MGDSYDERVKRIMDELNHTEPDVVPSMTAMGTYVIGFNDYTALEAEWNIPQNVENYLNTQKKLYADCVYTAGVVFDTAFAKAVGSPAHFIAEDGQTIQHLASTHMEADEYDKLINDTENFMINELLPRTATRLQGPYEEKRKAVLEFADHLQKKLWEWSEIERRLKEEYNRPVMAPSVNVYPPLDLIFDYYRGFDGIVKDMRRCPQKLLDACEAVLPFLWQGMGIPDGDDVVTPAMPPHATMMHIPTFISPKQFEKFFLPTYSKMINRVFETGGTMIMFLEGVWANKADWLNSLPKNKVFGLVEGDEPFEFKKLVGDNICLIGGMRLQTLKYGTKEACIEEAKKVIDNMAPGGGYIFGTSRELLTKTDLNYENLCATHAFVHEYAVK